MFAAVFPMGCYAEGGMKQKSRF